MSHPVLFVGSIPAKSAAEVFEALSSAVGGLAKRLPDGETGDRSRWIAWQSRALGQGSGLVVTARFERGPGDFVERYGVDPNAKEVVFGELGYAAAAIASYGDFKRLREAGKIAAGTRFQVCMPTPFAVVMAFVDQDYVATVWPAYEQAMKREVERIGEAIPANDWALQWDIAVEPVYVLGNAEMLRIFPEAELAASIARVSAATPAQTELGLHMCFGDTGQKFKISPDDLSDLVAFANRLAAAISHPIAWVHFPAPKKSDYETFFAPLKALRIDGAEIYIGLIGSEDGFEGAQERLRAVKRYLAQPGIATECGIGRRPADTLPAILDLHKRLANLD